MGKKNCRAEQATDGNMAHALCKLIPKATNSYSAYVILIAFPQQQWLRERSTVLCHTYTACV